MANSSILLDNDEKTEIPAAVRLAQQQGFLSMEQQPVVPVAKLFFSFDIVNSTVYKANTVNWPIIIKGLLDYIRRCVQREADLQGASLWRVIGDEMVFVYQIIDKRELYPAVDAIFRITQRVSLSIRTGKFFNTLEEQKLQKAEIEVLKSQEILSIKAAAWIAAISKEMKSPYAKTVPSELRIKQSCLSFATSIPTKIISFYLRRFILQCCLEPHLFAM